jgi:hypothetical protein
MAGEGRKERAVPARLTPEKGRSFGLTVGGAFLAIGAFVWWRGHVKTAAVLGALGLALAAAGLAMPTRLGAVERAWMGLAHAISKVTTPIVMGLMYYLVLTPIGIARRVFGANPMVHRPSAEGYWKERPEGERRTASLRRQF